jgi:hypothetical protein
MSDIANLFLVSMLAPERVAILNPPRHPMTRAEALNLAAWLVAIADNKGGAPGGDFDRSLRQVLKT